MADILEAPRFVITDAGLAVASVATPVGPFIHITEYRIGSAYGYTPLRTDTGINGTLLFQGPPISYRYIGDNTIDILCKLPADAGPFSFGEVALYLEDGTMFAKAVFDTEQVKYSSLGTNLLSTFTFHCLLKLEQAVAVFKIDTIDNIPPDVWEVDFWSDVYPPALSANPEIPTILVRELDINGHSSFIHQADGQYWTIGTNYNFLRSSLVTGSSTTYVDISESDLNPDATSAVGRKYVIRTEDGYFRSVATVTNLAGNFRFTLNPEPLETAPVIGQSIEIWSNDDVTKINFTGDATGSAYLDGGTVNVPITLTGQAIQGRVATFTTPGPISFTVPPEVFDLYISGCAAGGGAGSAGGGYTSGPTPFAYEGGGGGGSGAAGEAVDSFHMSVVPGQIITGVIGAKGIGGLGVPIGTNGNNGTDGGDTTFGTLILNGGEGGDGGGGPALTTAGGAGGLPSGNYGTDGNLGGSGGLGVSGPYGIGGGAGRSATSSVPSIIDGRDGTGFGSSGGGGAGIYIIDPVGISGKGGDGADGFLRITW